MIEEKEVYPVAFYFHMFKAGKLNYDMHNKEFLTVFGVFHT